MLRIPADIQGEGIDHIQAVYGWTREAALYSARVRSG